MIISAMGATASGGAAVGSSTDPGQTLTTEDLSILALENETVAGHTCKVILLEDRIEPEALRASIAARLDRAPQLSLRLTEVDGAPRWVPASELDLDAHVAVTGGPDPLDLLEFRKTVARTFEERLDRSRTTDSRLCAPRCERRLSRGCNPRSAARSAPNGKSRSRPWSSTGSATPPASWMAPR